MPISVKTINYLLTLSKWSFENARDRLDIQEKIKDLGYDVPRMDILITLNTQMTEKYQDQQKIRAEQDLAFTNYNEKYLEARKHCRNLRELARRVLEENEFEKYRRLLGIDERLKETFEGFIEQARKIYTRCIEDKEILTRLETKYKQTAEIFQARLQALDVLVDLHKKNETAKALSQVATRDRDNLFKEFKIEWGSFKNVCRIAYRDENNPQYQELVGIKIYSPGYRPAPDSEPPVPTPTPTPTPTPPTPTPPTPTPTPPTPPTPTILPTQLTPAAPMPGPLMVTPAETVTPLTPEITIKN